MSRNDWESGEIRLPSAEYARVRKALQEADTRHKEKVFEHTQRFWKGLTRKQQTDPKAYFQAHSDWENEMWARRSQVSGYSGGYDTPEDNAERDAIWETAPKIERWESVPGSMRREAVYAKPKRVVRTDIAFPTNRTNTFQAPDVSVRFDREKSTVTWSAGQGNRAVEAARRSHLGKAFFKTLDTVKWTRNTGGIFIGNDEYNEESGHYDAGSGGSYVTQGFGPIGAADPDAHSRTDDYIDSTGKRVRSSEFPGKKAEEKMWRAVARASEEQGRRRNGQFDNKAHSEQSGGLNTFGRWS